MLKIANDEMIEMACEFIVFGFTEDEKNASSEKMSKLKNPAKIQWAFVYSPKSQLVDLIWIKKTDSFDPINRSASLFQHAKYAHLNDHIDRRPNKDVEIASFEMKEKICRDILNGHLQRHKRCDSVEMYFSRDP